jgi:predicted cupin superfamily sugar epimerase
LAITAADIIHALRLEPHPEGGWYRETWRAHAADGERAGGTSIHFLLDAGQRSHWHRIDATELWLFQAGAPLTLWTAAGDQGEHGVVETRLGPNPTDGHALQHVVRSHEWQAAQAGDGWSLVACVVVPAFEFRHFELAPPGWRPAG